MSAHFLSDLIVAPAAAQTAAPSAGSFVTQLFPIMLILVVMYFLIIRPSIRKQRKLRESISKLRVGDRVLTAGGIEGTVTDIGDDQKLRLEIAEGVIVTVVKSTISGVFSESLS